MKKLLCVLLSAMMILTMAACGGKEQTATLTTDANGVSMEYVLEAKGDIVHTITQTSTIDCSIYTEEQIAMIEESVAMYQEQYDQIDGVTYTAGVEGTNFVEKIVIDASSEDTLNTLSAQGLLPIEGDSSSVSLDKTVDNLVSQGWVLQD